MATLVYFTSKALLVEDDVALNSSNTSVFIADQIYVGRLTDFSFVL